MLLLKAKKLQESNAVTTAVSRGNRMTNSIRPFCVYSARCIQTRRRAPARLHEGIEANRTLSVVRYHGERCSGLPPKKSMPLLRTLPHFAVSTGGAAACFEETPYATDHIVRPRHAFAMDRWPMTLHRTEMTARSGKSYPAKYRANTRLTTAASLSPVRSASRFTASM
jgi:hypothetical protein